MWLALVLVVIGIAYYVLYQNSLYWKKRNIPGPTPTFIVGNIGQTILMKKSMADVIADIYNEYKNLQFVGIFLALTPNLLVRDPELIKDITVKNFSHFQDNNVAVDKKVDPLFGRDPNVLKGDEWKHVRAQLTPAFSPVKIKSIYPLLEEVGKQLANFVKSLPKENNKTTYEGREMCSRFTASTVATCAFGLEANTFESEKSEFRETCEKFQEPSAWFMLKMLITPVFPKLSKFLPIRIVSRVAEKEITSIVHETLKYREINNIERNDFIHIMNEIRKKDSSFTLMDVTAHCSTFIFDGYDTSAIMMSFMLFELGANPKVQTKLRNEIREAMKRTNNKLEYEDVQGMAYLDAAFNETLRLHAPIPTLFKICTKAYTFTPSGENSKPVTIEKGTGIILPVQGLQSDAKHFPNPDKYMPERFLDKENVSNTKYAFMPFGLGPRSCLGLRFVYLQIKCGIIQMLNNFEIEVSEKTQLPFKYDPTSVLITPIGGIWLNFKEIEQ